MKKFLLLLLFAGGSLCSMAEDIIQVVPFSTEAGMTEDDEQYMSVQMSNTSADIANLQFDILLPEGMSIVEVWEGDKIPHTGSGSRTKYKFTIQWSELENGWYRILFVPVDLTPIEASGADELLSIQFATAEDMLPGVYPIYVDGTNLDLSVTEHIQPERSVSYVTVGDASLWKEKVVDLSEWTGMMPSWVCESFNEALAGDEALACLDLTGVTAANGDLDVPGHVLMYVTAGTDLAASLAERDNVVTVDEAGNVCANLVLEDGRPFVASKGFTAAKASYTRTLGDYATLVLPFEAAIPEGHRVYTVTGMEDATLELTELQGVIPARTPVVVETAGSAVLFAGENVDVTAEAPLAGAYLAGVFETGHYAVSGTYVLQTTAKGTAFNRVPDSVTNYPLLPFRAYLQLSDVYYEAKSLSLGIEEATGIRPVELDVEEGAAYGLNGILQLGLGRGIHLVKRADGSVQKVLVK